MLLQSTECFRNTNHFSYSYLSLSIHINVSYMSKVWQLTSQFGGMSLSLCSETSNINIPNAKTYDGMSIHKVPLTCFGGFTSGIGGRALAVRRMVLVGGSCVHILWIWTEPVTCNWLTDPYGARCRYEQKCCLLKAIWSKVLKIEINYWGVYKRI